MYLSSSLSKSSFFGSTGLPPFAAPPRPPLTAFTLPLPLAGGAVRGAAALEAAVVARVTPPRPPRPPLVPRVVAAAPRALGEGAGALVLDSLLGPSLDLAYF